MRSKSAALPSLSLPRMAAFATGDFACNLYWQSVSLFLLFYYTDAVGLSAAAAGLIYMVASIFDGAIDPFMGAISDRTRSRWGRYRPYILFGSLPLGFSFALLYYRPPVEGGLLIAIVLVVHLIFRVCYTALSIPYSSLTARMTASSGERSVLAGFRMIFATLAALTVAMTTQPMVKDFGGGNPSRGFFFAACVLAAIATLIFPMVFAVTREPPEPAIAEKKLSIGEYWKSVLGNRAFLVLMVGFCAAAMSSTALGKSVLYYFKYYLHDEADSRIALSLGGACGLVVIPAWMLITKFIGKRAVWLVASAWGLAGLGFFALVDIHSPTVMTAYLLYMQITSLGLAYTFWSMLPDTVEYGEWSTGMRTESFIFGLGSFFLKAALGLGAGAFGVALGMVGYVPNIAQNTQTLHGMKMIMILFPTTGIAVGAVAMYFYPLRQGVHESITEQLMERRAVPPEMTAPEAVV